VKKSSIPAFLNGRKRGSCGDPGREGQGFGQAKKGAHDRAAVFRSNIQRGENRSGRPNLKHAENTNKTAPKRDQGANSKPKQQKTQLPTIGREGCPGLGQKRGNCPKQAMAGKKKRDATMPGKPKKTQTQKPGTRMVETHKQCV